MIMHGSADRRAKDRLQSSENTSQTMIDNTGEKKGFYPIAWDPEAHRPTDRIVRDELVKHPMPMQFPCLIEHPKSPAGRRDDFGDMAEGRQGHARR
jgi:hypothetical protein